MSEIKGVTAIVGGSRGTGAALAHELLEEGGLVVVGYVEKDIRAKQVAGILDPEKRGQVLDPPAYGDRAMTAQIDVTDPESRIDFAEAVGVFADEHGTTVSTLALLGAAGIGKDARTSFEVNQEGQVLTARTFWESVDDVADPIALTIFAQSFQGHTALHPDVSLRAEFPDDYAAVALSKFNGEVGLRLLNYELNRSIDTTVHHTLGVVVGDALGDSDPIKLLKRRAGQAKDRVDSGAARDGDEAMVEQMTRLSDRDEELLSAGFEPVTTVAYAGLMAELIRKRSSGGFEVDRVTRYIPTKAVIRGRIVDLADTGDPLDWASGRVYNHREEG
jgi:NAD(P)-dependent dehydrogenase (short-subunit alcohol dehydrogenase family)